MSLSKAAPAATPNRAHNPERLERLCETARRIASRRKFPPCFTLGGYPVKPKLVLQDALYMDGPVPAELAAAANDQSCTSIRQLARRLKEDADAFDLWAPEEPAQRQPLATGDGKNVGPATDYSPAPVLRPVDPEVERRREAGVPAIRGSQLLVLATLARRVRETAPLPETITSNGAEEGTADFLARQWRDSSPCPDTIAQGFEVIGPVRTGTVAALILAVAKQEGLLAPNP